MATPSVAVVAMAAHGPMQFHIHHGKIILLLSDSIFPFRFFPLFLFRPLIVRLLLAVSCRADLSNTAIFEPEMRAARLQHGLYC